MTALLCQFTALTQQHQIFNVIINLALRRCGLAGSSHLPPVSEGQEGKSARQSLRDSQDATRETTTAAAAAAAMSASQTDKAQTEAQPGEAKAPPGSGQATAPDTSAAAVARGASKTGKPQAEAPPDKAKDPPGLILVSPPQEHAAGGTAGQEGSEGPPAQPHYAARLTHPSAASAAPWGTEAPLSQSTGEDSAPAAHPQDATQQTHPAAEVATTPAEADIALTGSSQADVPQSSASSAQVAGSPEAPATEQAGPSAEPLGGVNAQEAAERAAAEESAQTGISRKHDSEAAESEKQEAAAQPGQPDMAVITPSASQSTGDGRAITPFAAAAGAVQSSAGVCYLVLCCWQSAKCLKRLLCDLCKGTPLYESGLVRAWSLI